MGELLIEEGIITQEELVRAIGEGGIKGTALAAILEACPHVRRSELAAFLSSDFRIPTIDDLRKVEIPEGASRLVPEEVCRKHELAPVARIGEILCVAKASYFNRAAIQEIRRVTGLRVKVLQADEVQVRAAIERLYRGRRGELPAPGQTRKQETSVVRAAPPPGRAAAALEAVPLISMPDEDGAARIPTAISAAVRAESYDEVIEILDAVRIPPHEFAAALRDPFARLVVEFDEVFHVGRAVPPFRLS